MAFTKFASFEVSKILEVKGAPAKAKTASLRTLSDFHDYRTDDGYLYVRIRAISSRVNKNHDGWPTAELAGGKEAWEKAASQHQSASGFTLEASKDSKRGFSTFIGKPIFVDHNNSDPRRTRGVIVDSKFRVLDQKTAAEDDYWGGRDGKIDPEHNPPSEVELLLEVDAKQFPVFAKAIESRELDGFSMGCDVDYTKCSHCGHEASSPDEFCSHIVMKGAEHTIEAGEHKGKTAKSYENCYGQSYFEISGVFDPADETATSREVLAAIEKEADAYVQPTPEQVLQEARRMIVDNPGMSIVEAMPMAEQAISQRFAIDPDAVHGEGYNSEYDRSVPRDQFTSLPPDFPSLGLGTPRYQGSYLGAKIAAEKLADNPEPQSFHTTAPESVDTLREDKVCPLCGSDMDADKCAVCGYEEPPESLQNPDLQRAQETGAEDELQDEATPPPEEAAPDAAAGGEAAPQETYLNATNPEHASSVTSEMRWEPRGIELSKLAADRPQGDEPTETVIADQDKPVTSAFRTAQQMIDAARTRKENTMADEKQKVAAEPADASGKAQKNVDVTGTGGVIDATNEKASEPTGPRSFENAGTTVNVDGSGGVIEDTNAEASKPSAGTESLPAGEQDNAGFQSGGQKGPKTQTWNNSNEPGSAVTDKAVQAAKQGVKPIGPSDVQPSDRVNLEQDGPTPGPQSGTDQWTGTDGNGVTKQQNPVTQKSFASTGMVSLAALRLADLETSMGLVSEDGKYDRLAELSLMEEAEVEAEHRALAKVKVAATRRTAATAQGGVGRVPAFNKRVASEEPKTAQVVDDGVMDSALFS